MSGPGPLRPARPTLRCLREDLCLAVPPVTVPLDEIDHPVLAKASEQFADEDGKHERIRSVDDQVLFKVKVQRWRGAVWLDADLPWLVAAGRREDGSGEDFYAALEADGRAVRARYNAEHSDGLKTATHTAHLLPEREDHVRYRAEAGVRFVRRLRATLLDLAHATLRDGREHTREFDTFTLGLQVRADDGHETYLAVRITGSVPPNLTVLILRNVPGCEAEGWYPEYALPERDLLPAEQAWSNLMDPRAAAQVLNEER
ncbi:hypothetical protein SAMN06272771_2742 [Streptomyces sp. Ag82_O1-12]|uniref:hypothetical protein n=1 Tax=unclassified Streptomyces TaxID=2593676 RepID=UPI000BD330AD|nr:MULTISPECIES: hypothetical protein [unclassified Streptomyces]SMQ16380.1 hypothetical protein SAMN06272771_2742 [Streptomyces sp. Ag82_O1-12]SOD45410.1 hypothetical protein SAMN06272727_2739 [Streptomyces sp. Ag82_G6-1]